MVEESRQGRLEHPDVHHERTDASFRAIVGVAVVSIVLAIIIHGALLWFLFHYGDYLAERRESSFPVATQQRDQLQPGPGSHPLNGGAQAGQRESLPPEPRLDPINVREGIPEASPAELYARDTTLLHSYGPTQEKEFIHIPIDRAMTFLAGKLPARTEPAPAERHDLGLRDGGESNSGRLFREKPR